MKSLLLSLLLGRLFIPQAGAQKIIEKHIDFGQKDMVALNIQIADSIRILTWNKNEVYVKASVNINDNQDNDLYQTAFGDSNSNTVAVQAKVIDHEKTNRGWNEKCNCYCMQSRIYWDVYIPENAAFSVETIDGNIIINGQTDEIKAHTISGFIDLVFASSRKADLKMSTISGTIYTNLAISKPKGHRGGNEISSEYNGGGKRVDLETISGDIFLRKAE